MIALTCSRGAAGMCSLPPSSTLSLADGGCAASAPDTALHLGLMQLLAEMCCEQRLAGLGLSSLEKKRFGVT